MPERWGSEPPPDLVGLAGGVGASPPSPEATGPAARRRPGPVYVVGMSSPIEVSEVTEVTPEVVAAFERLIPQLSRSNPPPDEQPSSA